MITYAITKLNTHELTMNIKVSREGYGDRMIKLPYSPYQINKEDIEGTRKELLNNIHNGIRAINWELDVDQLAREVSDILNINEERSLPEEDLNTINSEGIHRETI